MTTDRVKTILHASATPLTTPGAARQPSESGRMANHFTSLAPAYNDLRTTDEAPVQFIAEMLAARQVESCADVGCGSGRYDLLLLRAFPGLRLTCCDINQAMLDEAGRYLRANGEPHFGLQLANAESLPAAGERLDFITCFNAIHHFDPPAFLRRASSLLKPGGYVFVYTRLQEQNRDTIWGRHFPCFLAKERRLYRLEQVHRWARSMDNLALERVQLFHFTRTTSLRRLIALAKARHYSTFAYYSDTDLREALDLFRHRILSAYPDPEIIQWQEGNAMIVLRSTRAP